MHHILKFSSQLFPQNYPTIPIKFILNLDRNSYCLTKLITNFIKISWYKLLEKRSYRNYSKIL